MMERTEGGTCHNDKPGHLKGSRRGGCVVWLFLAFPFGCWGIDSRRRGRGTIFFTFRFAFSFAWSLTLSFLALAFAFAFTFAFGNVSVGRIVVSNIPVFIWVSSDPWGGGRRGVVPGAPTGVKWHRRAMKRLALAAMQHMPIYTPITP